MPETSASILFKAMDQDRTQVKVPIMNTVITRRPKQTGGIVHLDPARSIINATNLATAAGHTRTILINLRKDFTSCTFVRVYGRQGTYVNYEDGLKLCDRFNLPKMVVKEAMDTGQMFVRIPAARSRSRTPPPVEQDRRVTDEDELPAQASPPILVLSPKLNAENDVYVSGAVTQDVNQASQELIEILSGEEGSSEEERDFNVDESTEDVEQSDIEKSEGNELCEEDLSEDESSEEDEISEENGPSKTNETSEDDPSENETASNSYRAGSPPRAMSQPPFLSEVGALTPLQQFYPRCGPSSFYSAVSSDTSIIYP
jgi:hypothetical protein